MWLLVGVDELSSGLGAVGVAVDGDDLGVVDEAVDECGGNDIVGEDFAPVVPRNRGGLLYAASGSVTAVFS